MRVADKIAKQEGCDGKRTGSDKSPEFILLGHDSPLGRYPAPVVPVGLLNGQLVALYPGGSPSPGVEPVDETQSYVHHDRRLRKALIHFDYRIERLFAFTRVRVISYPIAAERQFFQKVLPVAPIPRLRVRKSGNS